MQKIKMSRGVTLSISEKSSTLNKNHQTTNNGRKSPSEHKVRLRICYMFLFLIVRHRAVFGNRSINHNARQATAYISTFSAPNFTQRI